MKRIPLTQGQFALVDDEDFELVSRFKWHVCKGYARTCMYIGTVGGKTLNVCMYLHQLILRPPPGTQVDHRKHIKLDCRRLDIRVCTNQENSQNSLRQGGKSSKYKGVSWYKAGAKWRAYIGHNGKHIHLGYFDDELDAARAYDHAAVELFGEFALLNFPKGKRLKYAM